MFFIIKYSDCSRRIFIFLDMFFIIVYIIVSPISKPITG